jgi:hypothetical protein
MSTNMSTDIFAGPLQPEYGFSSFRKIPGTNGLFLALKTKELSNQGGGSGGGDSTGGSDGVGASGDPFTLDSNDGDVTETVITVFDTKGNFYLDPPFQLVGNHKFEGLEFV